MNERLVLNRLMSPCIRLLVVWIFWLGPVGMLTAAPEEIPMPDTQVHEFVSQHTGRHYQLRIGLPRNYDPANRSYTVVYQTDGQWDFDRVFPMLRAMEYDQIAEPFILVAMTYAGNNPDYGALRQMDYTPTDFVGGGQSGQAHLFLRTVRNEIIPLVEANYACRTDERILMGSSYGGLFTCYALLHAPDLFTGYVPSSPSLWVDNYVMVREATTFGPGLRGRNLRVRMITGLNEAYGQRNSAERFLAALQALGIQDLDIDLEFAANERHGAVAQVAYYEGLPEVVRPKLVTFARGTGEPVNWSGTQIVQTFHADDVMRVTDAGTGAKRRAMVFEPGDERATSVGGVIYVLDAQWDLRYTDATYWALDYDGELSNRLRVGLDWEGSPREIMTWREQEYRWLDDTVDAATPVVGGAFRSYFGDTVQPWAEGNLVTAPGFRMVIASEKAATWALADLLSHAPMFDRYLLVSPDVGDAGGNLRMLEAARAERGGSLTARVLIYSGNNEAVERRENLQAFVSQLAQRGHAGLEISHTQLDYKGYAQAKLEGYHKGLRILGR